MTYAELHSYSMVSWNSRLHQVDKVTLDKARTEWHCSQLS